MSPMIAQPYAIEPIGADSAWLSIAPEASLPWALQETVPAERRASSTVEWSHLDAAGWDVYLLAYEE